jgi:GrpB-like predicted nucleotidyltransferase (UPF0157 family)
LTPAIVIAAYDAAWPKVFAALAAHLAAVLGGRAAAIEHVGSTAVPGLAAKPIVDVDVVVATASDLAPAIAALTADGYVHEGDLGVPGREALRAPAGATPHHLYVLVAGSAELRRHLAFRDALRADAALRDAYAALKRTLAQRHAEDRAAYTKGKSAFIAAVLAHPVQQR